MNAGTPPSPLPLRGKSRMALALGWACAAVLPALAAPPAPASSAAPAPASASASSSSSAAAAARPPGVLAPCRLSGVKHEALCGHVRRPLDPTAPGGASIDVHFAVIPALARHKKLDPVFFFAGGPGQSAISLAGPVASALERLGNRRDLVLIDQRGTGRSAPLLCPEVAPTRPLGQALDTKENAARLADCLQALKRLPHGDLRHYTTVVATADVEAVRAVLGAERINLVGGSYGTRAALDYLRQYPDRVRRTLLDGVAPPDMALPGAFATDAQAALESLFDDCAKDAACTARHGDLRARWQDLRRSLPRDVTLTHPVTGQPDRITVTLDLLDGLVRPVLYAPVLVSAMPHALAQAAEGRFTPLVGLAMALGGGRGEQRMAEGMHFSVICAEDLPRTVGGTAPAPSAPAAATAPPATASPATAPAAAPRAGGADPGFGADFPAFYRTVCAEWPRGAVPEAFYRVPAARTPVLVLSGGLDPVTPPRHGERVARALGEGARHAVVRNAGHGLMFNGCLRDVVFRFIDADTDADARSVDATCAARLPRPPAWQPAGLTEAAK